MSRKVNVGIVGCGSISDAYFIGSKKFDILNIVACADLDPARAEAKAAKYGVRACATVADLINDPEVEIVVNLTVPKAHVEVNLAALKAGKHAYCEKPFGLNPAESAKVIALAKKKKLLVGSAPDTFLGGGIQTARKLVDDGAIGRPVAALAFMMCRGHESWHPSPQFYYQKGGGPMFDMGPYYLTALVNLLGPARRVTGSTAKTFRERLITSQPFNGTKIPVETPTHLTGTIEFANGAIATVVMSFDTWPYPLPCIVLYGTESTMEVPDPNSFGGPVKLRSADGKAYHEIAHTHTTDRGRGAGVADMAYSILRRSRKHRANGDLAQHVVEIMAAFERASTSGKAVVLKTTCKRPAALPVGLAPNELDA
ncbi:MAG: Gfo/Idh/MocA family oxidoreductase [Verrucomicrobia bacterium]|nr:Gfo/Idh/MocA family oxidoreductase [Verrucomicrobiota bacterium]